MGNKDNVKQIYGLLNAKWYDIFRKPWTKYVSEKAEEEFTRILRKNIKPNSKILELGCGTGINIGRIKDLEFKSYTGLDFSEEMLNIAIRRYGKLKNVSLIKKDITKPLGDQKYDIILSTWVMSHLDEPSEVINDCYSHLNNDGLILFIFLTKPEWYINFWFYPLTRLFACRYVSHDEIRRIRHRKNINKYSAGITTLLEIRR